MKKSDLKRLEEIIRQEDEKFSVDDVNTLEFAKEIDKYLPEHLKRFHDLTDEEIDEAIASSDFIDKEKERFNKFYKPICDQINAEEKEQARIMKAELAPSDISDRDCMMFEINRFFPEFKKHYKEGTIGSDMQFCRRLIKLIRFGESIGEDPMSELICRMNLK